MCARIAIIIASLSKCLFCKAIVEQGILLAYCSNICTSVKLGNLQNDLNTMWFLINLQKLVRGDVKYAEKRNRPSW